MGPMPVLATIANAPILMPATPASALRDTKATLTSSTDAKVHLHVPYFSVQRLSFYKSTNASFLLEDKANILRITNIKRLHLKSLH